MADISADTRAVVEAIQDLTRVTIALHGDFESKSDAIRRLTELSIPPGRVATILSIPPGDVHSVVSKAKKRATVEGAKVPKPTHAKGGVGESAIPSMRINGERADG